MAWVPPTIKELSLSFRAKLRAAIPTIDPFIWPNNMYIWGKVTAAMLRGAYLRIEEIRKQARAVTATGEDLEGHGSDIGIIRNTATYASGIINVTAPLGTTIPIGTRFLRSDGVVFISWIEDVVTDVDTDDVAVRAEEAGKLGNTEATTLLRLETPISGVGTIDVNDDGLFGGTDTENDASLRARILFRKRNPPHGGSPSEYIDWGLAFPGVSRVWPLRITPAAGYVTVLFMMDDVYDNGIPSPADVSAFQTYLNTVAPADANVIAAAPAPVPISIVVNNLYPNTGVVQNEAIKEIKAAFRREASPATSLTPAVFSRSWIEEAISNATGERRHILTTPAADVYTYFNTAGEYEIAVAGAISFT